MIKELGCLEKENMCLLIFNGDKQMSYTKHKLCALEMAFTLIHIKVIVFVYIPLFRLSRIRLYIRSSAFLLFKAKNAKIRTTMNIASNNAVLTPAENSTPKN